MKLINTVKLIPLLAAATLMSGCDSGGGSSSSSSSLTVAGSLGGPSGSSKMTLNKVGAQAITDYAVRCVTLNESPQAGSGNVGSDGSFSLNLTVSDGSSVPIGCFVVRAADSEVAATFSFDSGSQGIGATGSDTAQTGSVSGGKGESIDFGTINFDADKGTAVVDKSSITRTGSVSSSSGSWSDPTGAWTMTCITAASDYSCPDDAVNNQFPLYLNQMEATDTGAVAHNGLSIWKDQSSFTSCGSTEDLNGVLPAGWVSSNTALDTDFSYDGLPAANTLDAPVWGSGNASVCGFAVTPGVTKCSDISANTDGWDFGGGILTAADCQALCQADMAEEASGGTCVASLIRNHSVLSGIAPGAIATEVASLSGGSTTNNFLVQDDRPEARYVLGELEIDGNVGTVMDSKSRTEHFCKDNGDGSGCTDVSCVITENVRVTIRQSSASAATVEVVIQNTLDSQASDSDCLVSSQENHLEDEIDRTEKFLLSASKN